jgi:glycosyltransferase involved in cell wall biosynthesis
VNILHIIRSVNPADGGPIEGIKQLGATLNGAGHHVEILSLDSPAAPFVKDSPLPVYPLGPTVSKYGYSSRMIPWLRANHRKYDCVVVNGLWQFHGFGTWLALHKAETPYVVYTHGMLDPWFRYQYPLKHLKKWLYWPWAEYRVVRDAKAVLFTCEEERLLARKSFWLYQSKEVVAGYGTATPQGDPASEMQEFFGKYGTLRDKKLVLFMGRIHPKKGCDLLIEAFATVLRQEEDCHLVMAGPDQTGWQESLRQRAAQLGLTSRITWTGMLSGKMKWGALRAADVFVLPSHQENFGIAVAEALAVGLPTLISDKVNIWREVDADGAGIVGEDTLDGTCRMLLSYLAMSEENKRAMRRCARSCFERRFEIKKAAANLEAILSGVTG